MPSIEIVQPGVEWEHENPRMSEEVTQFVVLGGYERMDPVNIDIKNRGSGGPAMPGRNPWWGGFPAHFYVTEAGVIHEARPLKYRGAGFGRDRDDGAVQVWAWGPWRAKIDYNLWDMPLAQLQALIDLKKHMESNYDRALLWKMYINKRYIPATNMPVAYDRLVDGSWFMQYLFTKRRKARIV